MQIERKIIPLEDVVSVAEFEFGRWAIIPERRK